MDPEIRNIYILQLPIKKYKLLKCIEMLGMVNYPLPYTLQLEKNVFSGWVKKNLVQKRWVGTERKVYICLTLSSDRINRLKMMSYLGSVVSTENFKSIRFISW